MYDFHPVRAGRTCHACVDFEHYKSLKGHVTNSMNGTYHILCAYCNMLSQGSESLEARYFPTSPEAVIEEHVLWSYCIQLASGLRAIHVRVFEGKCQNPPTKLLNGEGILWLQASGRACRALDLSKVMASLRSSIPSMCSHCSMVLTSIDIGPAIGPGDKSSQDQWSRTQGCSAV